MSSAGDVLRLRESLSGKLDEREPIPQRFRATMGDGTGAVVVPGKPNYVYVRRLGRGLIEECLNNKAAARDGLPIIAGYSHESPDVLQVLEVDWYSFSAPGAYPYTQHHHDAHELHNVVGGDDVVWVQSQQLMPLLVYPTNPATMRVNVFGGWYPWASGWHYFEPTLSADLTARVPALAANARYVLISIDGATEALQYTNGVVFPIFMPPVDAENMVPAPPAGSIPIGAVYLPNGTATLDWDNLYDMRLFNQPVGGSITPGVHALLDTTVHSDTATDIPSQGSLIIGNATPAWDELVHPGAAGYALVSGAVTFAWSLAPTWLGTHTWGSGFDLLPTDATGQALGAAGTRWDLHTQDVYFEGATGSNIITITDNLADALHVVDTGDGDIFLQIVTTTGSEEIILNAGADDVDFTVQAVGVADALQVRGSDGQITLGVLTAGYVKSSAGGVLSVATEVPLIDLGSYTQGDLIYGGAADWQDLAIGGIGDFLWVNAAGTEPEWHTLVVGDIPAHALLGTQHSDTTTDAPTRGSLIYANATPLWDELDHPAAAGYALTTDANDVVWDQTPLWSGAHTHAADIILDDGAGDSPQLQFIGGSNNDTVLMYLDDNAVAGDSDLVIRLCAADTGSQLIIQDNSPATVAYIDADGNADFIGHMAVGASASVASTSIINVSENFTPLAGTYIGVYSAPTFTPGAASAAKIRAMQFTVTANAAVAMTGNVVGVAGNVICAAAATLARMSGLECKVLVSNGVAANITDLEGIRLAVIDAEDATVTRAASLLMFTPSVDTGTLSTGYGIRIREGTKGAGVYTTQYGILVESIDNAVTNYAIYTNVGLVHFGDQVEIIGSAAADVQLIVRGAAAQSASLVQYQDSAGNIFFDSGDGLVNSEVVWNEQGLDIDFRVEGVGQANALFVQGSDGNVGIGCTPSYKLDLYVDGVAFSARFFNDGDNIARHGIIVRGGADNPATVGTTYFFYAQDGSGAATGVLKTTNGVFSLADASDERRKTKIKDTKLVGLDIVNRLRVRDYNWKTSPDGPMMTSFVAQEAQKVFPAMIGEGPDGTLMTSRAMLIPVLTKAIQELDARLTKLGAVRL